MKLLSNEWKSGISSAYFRSVHEFAFWMQRKINNGNRKNFVDSMDLTAWAIDSRAKQIVNYFCTEAFFVRSFVR